MYFDWQKYKRVFAFGCSFTAYTYPTWASLIFQECTNAEHYNFAKPGMGNLGIASRIAEANTKYNFNEDDLILVMYTTFFREDRWITDRWETHGCVYSQGYYNKNFVKNYVDPIGCLIRDFAQIELSTRYLNSLPCDTLMLKASDIRDEGKHFIYESPNRYDAITATYDTLWNQFPPSLREVMFPNGWEVRSKRLSNGKEHIDRHPITIDYYDYLIKLGLNLSESTREYAIMSSEKIQYIVHSEEEWKNQFPEVEKQNRTLDFLF